MSFPYSTTLIFCKQIDVSQPANVCFFSFLLQADLLQADFFFNIDTFCLNILLLTKENKISHPLHPIIIKINPTQSAMQYFYGSNIFWGYQISRRARNLRRFPSPRAAAEEEIFIVESALRTDALNKKT